MDTFFEGHKLPQLTKEERGDVAIPISNIETAFV